MTFTPHANAPEWAASQATPWLTMNQAHRLFDAFAVETTIKDRDLAAPPASCADGDRYIVAASPTGLWAGKAGSLAVAVGTNAVNGWLFVPAAEIQVAGVSIYVEDENRTLQWHGGAWIVGLIAFVDMTGATNGATVKWNSTTGYFYL